MWVKQLEQGLPNVFSNNDTDKKDGNWLTYFFAVKRLSLQSLLL